MYNSKWTSTWTVMIIIYTTPSFGPKDKTFRQVSKGFGKHFSKKYKRVTVRVTHFVSCPKVKTESYGTTGVICGLRSVERDPTLQWTSGNGDGTPLFLIPTPEISFHSPGGLKSPGAPYKRYPWPDSRTDMNSPCIPLPPSGTFTGHSYLSQLFCNKNLLLERKSLRLYIS